MHLPAHLTRGEAVIFDLDGTLINSLQDITDCMNRVLLARGFPTHSAETYRYFVGEGATLFVMRSLPPERRSEALAAECLLEYREEYAHGWNIKTRAYEGVPELLEALAARGLAMAVLSNKSQPFVELCVGEFFPGVHFAAVRGQREGSPMKPDPAPLMEVAATIGIPPERVVFVGDSDVDMAAATAAGMVAVGALWGYRTEEELREHGARVLVSRPDEVLRLARERNDEPAPLG